MGEIFDYVDELGPTKVMHVYEPRSELKGVLVIDNVAAGPSIGGLRMAPDVSTRECARLARAMTLKNAAAGLPHGGGKSVLFGDPKMHREEKERLIREFACALKGETGLYLRARTWAPTKSAWPGSRTRSAVPWACPGRWAASRWTRSAPPAGASAMWWTWP